MVRKLTIILAPAAPPFSSRIRTSVLAAASTMAELACAMSRSKEGIGSRLQSV